MRRRRVGLLSRMRVDREPVCLFRKRAARTSRFMTGAAIAGAVGGIVAAALTLIGVVLSARWRIAEENIIKERAKWREAVRKIVVEAAIVSTPERATELWASLALRMNPNNDPDKDDRELVDLVGSLADEANRTPIVRARIVSLAAHILKHDWERAKWEAHGLPWTDEPMQERLP